MSSHSVEQFEFKSGHARHDFVAPGPPVLRVQTAWACPDRGHSLQLEPAADVPSPAGVVNLRLVLVPQQGGFAPAEPGVQTAEYTMTTDRDVRRVVVLNTGASLPVTSWMPPRRI